MLQLEYQDRAPAAFVGSVGSNNYIAAISSSQRMIYCYHVMKSGLNRFKQIPVHGSSDWRRTAFLLPNGNDYYLSSSFHLALSPCGNRIAFSTPDLGLSVHALSDSVVHQLSGQPGMIWHLAWVGDYIIAGRLIGEVLSESNPLRGDLLVYDFANKKWMTCNQSVFGKIVCSSYNSIFCCLNDEQGATSVLFARDSFPFHDIPPRMTCYVRPDGVALNSIGSRLAILELDDAVRLVLIDAIHKTVLHEAIIRQSTTRPDAALNLNLIAFDDQNNVYFPGPDRTLYICRSVSYSSEQVLQMESEIVGISGLPDNRICLTEANGTVSVYKVCL